MKLISLRLKNINSLKGEHIIDFSVPPLSASPIFMISGATGSGKTTILDAITTALYDRTPRLGRNTKLLKSQTAQTAMIELKYIIGGGEYRNVWQIDKRDNKKVAVYENGDQAEDVKINSLSGKTEKLIGLDYESFIRTIILAQNRFDEFLKSKPDERRKIIETLTDNQALEKMKVKIKEEYEFFKNEYRQKKERLDSLDALSGGENIQKLDCDRCEIEREISETKTLLDCVSKSLAECLALKESAESFDTIKSKLAKLETSFDFNQAAKEVETLILVREHFKQIIDTKKLLAHQLEDKRNEKIKESRQVLAIKEEALKRSGEYETAEEEFETFKIFYETRIPQIYNAIAISEKVSMISEDIGDVKKKAAAKASEAEACGQVIGGLERKLESLRLSDKSVSLELLNYALYENSREAYLEFVSGADKIKNLDGAKERIEKEICLCSKFIEEKCAFRSLESASLESLKRESAELKISLAADVERKKELERSFETAGEFAAAGKLRMALKDYEKCPVCGSVEHPDAGKTLDCCLDVSKLSLEIAGLGEKNAGTLEKIHGIEKNISAREALIQGIDSALKEKADSIGRLGADIEVICAEKKALEKSSKPLAPLSGLTHDEAVKRWGASLKTLENAKVHAAELNKNIEIAENMLLNYKNNLESLNGALEDMKKRSQALCENRTGLVNELNLITTGFDANEIKSELEKKFAALESKYKLTLNELNFVNANLLSKSEIVENIERQIIELGNRYGEQEKKFAAALFKSGLTGTEVEREYQRLGMLPGLEKAYNENMIQRKSLESKLFDLDLKIGGRQYDVGAHEQMARKEKELNEVIESLNRGFGEISAKIKNIARIQEELSRARAEFESVVRGQRALEKLYFVTKDNQFRDYVLSFYLKNLLALSNRYLKKLTGGRYELAFDLESSNSISIKDYLNEGLEREIGTVSGGESFMASLSLALGLSQISLGDSSVEFMFLDEGFGVLDLESLDYVMDMISNLNDIGKKIGVISHIAEVKERIETRIEIIKNNDGSSYIKID